MTEKKSEKNQPSGLLRDDEQRIISAKTDLPRDQRQAIINQLRSKYSNNPEALRQINIYDPESEYHQLHQEYIQAFLTNNVPEQKRLEDEVNKKFPKIKS